MWSISSNINRKSRKEKRMAEAAETTEVQPDTRMAVEPSTFNIPDSYQEKPWAQNIKSADDLWREVDTLQPLIGKKTIPDAESSDEEWDNFYNNFRPESPDKYELNVGDVVNEEVFGKYKEVFHELGLSNKQAQGLIEKHAEIESGIAPDTSDEGFKELTAQAFGEDSAKVINNANSLLKDLPEAQAEAIQGLPNEQLVSVLSLLNNVHQKYSREDAPISQGQAPTGMSRDEILSKMQTLRTEVRTLDVMDSKGRDAKNQELAKYREMLQRIENK